MTRFVVLYYLLGVSINAQPTISTFAGRPPLEGTAIGLQFGTKQTSGLAEDLLGNLFFAANNVIYKLTPSGDVIRYAGTGWENGSTADGLPARDARLAGPVRPLVGSDGNLYFLETRNRNTIRMVEAATGLLRTVFTPAPDTQLSYSMPIYALDLDSSPFVVRRQWDPTYYANYVTVHRVNRQTKALEPFVGTDVNVQTRLADDDMLATQAWLGLLPDLSVGPNGDLILLIGGSNTPLRRVVRATGTLQTLVRDYYFPGAHTVRALPNGDVFVTGYLVWRVTRSAANPISVAGDVAGDSAWITEGAEATAAGGDFSGAIQRANGDIVVAYFGPQPIWRIDSTGRYRSMVGDPSVNPTRGLPGESFLYSPYQILALPDNKGLLGLELGTGALLLKDGSPVSQLFPPAVPTLREWVSDLNGNVFAVGLGWAGFFRYDAAARKLSEVVATVPEQYRNSDPSSIGVTREGDLLFANRQRPTMVRWNGASWVDFAAGGYQGGSLRTAQNGDIYYRGANGFGRFIPSMNKFEVIQGYGSSAIVPLKFDIDDQGSIYFLDSNNLYRLDTGTYLLTKLAGGADVVEDGPSLGAALNADILSVDRKTGDVYLLDFEFARIRRVRGAQTYWPNPDLTIRSGSSLTAGPGGVTSTLTIGVRSVAMPWTAVSDSTWIRFGSSPSGVGTGVLTLVIEPNPLPSPRSGTVRIGSQIFTVNQQGATAEGLQYFPVVPCRIADTRVAPAGPLGQPALAAKSIRDFVIAGGPCGLPPTARAYALNVTVVPKGQLGFLSIWPAGQSQPVVSTLNALDGRVKANAAIVSAGVNSAVSVYATDSTELILDISGYFATPASGSGGRDYFPQAPCRILDTRLGLNPQPVHGQRWVDPSVCGNPGFTRAFPVNFTAIPEKALGFLALYDAASRPSVSVLNALTGTVTANAAIVQLEENLAFRVYTTDPAHLVADVNGYFEAASGGLRFYPVRPCRVLDTRTGGGAPASARSTLDIPVSATGCGIPVTAKAYALNATVVPGGVFGYLTLWPTGATRPLVSTLNAVDGSITSNAAIVATGTNGAISAYLSDSTHLLVDINGYFAP